MTMSRVNCSRDIILVLSGSICIMFLLFSDIQGKECRTCGRLFESESVLLVHQKRSHGAPTQKCLQCGGVFVNLDALRSHACTGAVTEAAAGAGTESSGVNTDVNKRVCELCGLAVHKSSISRHMKIHTGEKLLFECETCGKTYANNSNLNRHMQLHSETTSFICGVCKKAFKQKEGLSQHMLIHQEKKHICSTCGRGFTQVGHLILHERIHTGEKPYICTQCGYRTAHQGHLNRHMKTHSQEKPHACDICDYKTAYPDHLKSHMRTHTGEKKPCA